MKVWEASEYFDSNSLQQIIKLFSALHVTALIGHLKRRKTAFATNSVPRHGIIIVFHKAYSLFFYYY